MKVRSAQGGFFAGLALLGFMLAAAGCQSGDNGLSGVTAKDAGPLKPPTAKVLDSDLTGYCPRVSLRDGTTYFTTYAKNTPKPKAKHKASKQTTADAQAAADAQDAATQPQDDSAKIIYQSAITDVTRDCTHSNGMLNLTVAAAGKVVPGPMASAGSITMPIRIAVMHGGDVLYSKLTPYQVQVTDLSAATQFVFKQDGISVPDTTARDYQVYAGFDEGAPPKDKKSKKSAATN